MEANDLITRVSQVFRRTNGSEAKIVAQAMFGIGGHQSIDVFVLRRESISDEWSLCSDRPHPEWRTMSVDDYVQRGRSEMLSSVSPAEILSLTRLIGQPLSQMQKEGLVQS